MLPLVLVTLLLAGSSWGNDVSPDLPTSLTEGAHPQITALNSSINQLITALRKALKDLDSRPDSSLDELKQFIDQVYGFQRQVNDNKQKLGVIKNGMNEYDQSTYDLALSKATRAITEAESLVNQVKRKREEMERKRRPVECADAIKSRDFSTANERLDDIQDDTQIKAIVDRVYAKDVDKASLLLDFAEFLDDKERAYHVYHALGDQLQNNGHANTINLIKLINSLKQTVAEHNNTPANTKSRANELSTVLRTHLKAQALKELKASVNPKGYDTILADKIYDFDQSLFEALIKPVTADLLRLNGKMPPPPPENIIRRSPRQALMAAKVMFDQLATNGQLGKSSIPMAKILIELSKSSPLSKSDRDSIEAMLNNLPDPARLIASGNNLCIINIQYGEHMFASVNYKAGPNKRRVFTWVPKTDIGGRIWKIKQKSFYHSVTNTNNNEDLMAGSDVYDSQRRNVFSDMRGANNNDGNWDIEIENNTVYFRNVDRNEYLYAAESNYNFCGARRKVFTWHSGRHPQSAWKLTSC